MQRNPRPQDISWFLDLNSRNQLDLNPPYQRRSVWTRKDKELFLDTIFHNYPCPPIFLHKSMSEDGQATYHVVDGKQRLETIIAFAAGKIKIPATFGDETLNGKRWDELSPEAKRTFWDYSIATEVLPVIDEAVVNTVFERINRNSRKLTNQELRHAKFDGWLATFVEDQAADEAWEKIGLVTKARVKRMADVQFVSECLLVVIRNDVVGFDQDVIDAAYAEFDDPDEASLPLTTDEIATKFNAAKHVLERLCTEQSAIKDHVKTLANLYSLWAWAVLHPTQAARTDVATKYPRFMSRVHDFLAVPGTRFAAADPQRAFDIAANEYAVNLGGASTDERPRRARAVALSAGMSS